MKRVINSFVLAFVAVLTTFAQDCEIQLAAQVDDSSSIPEVSKKQFESVLTRLATENGATKTLTFAQFLISAQIDVLDKHVVAGPPPTYVNELGITFYVMDKSTKSRIATTYYEVNGVGESEIKSFNNAIRTLRPQNKKIQEFMQTAKTKILAYYDKQYPQILQEAQRMAGLKKYGKALAMVCAVPTCSKGGKAATTLGLKIYAQCRDRYAQQLLAEAKALWASNPTADGASQVAEILAKIDPEASCHKDVNALVATINKTARADYDFDNRTIVEIEKLRIQAIRDIAVAEATGKRPTIIVSGGRSTPVVVNSDGQTSSINSSDQIKMSDVQSGAMTGSQIFQKYNTAVFTIYIPTEKGYCQGSGFFINSDGTAVTNYHVFDGMDLSKAQLKVPGTNTVYGVSKILKSSKDNDFVVFKANCSSCNSIPVATTRPNVGDKVFAIGSPKGMENTFSSGEISQWRGQNLIQTTVMIDHGSSGGALINENGKVIGITSGTFNSESVANLNYAISIDAIK